MKLAVLFNPDATKNRKNPCIGRNLEEMVRREHGLFRSLTVTDHSRIIEEDMKIARQFKEEGIDFVGICGGDGTIHKFLTAMLTVYGYEGEMYRNQKLPDFPKVAAINGGNFCVIANKFNLHKRPDENLARLLREYHQKDCFPQVTDATTLRIQSNGNTEFGFIFGIGAIERFYTDYDKNPTAANALAMMTHVTGSHILGRSYAKGLFTEMPETVKINGEQESADLNVVVASMMDIKLFGCRPFPLAKDGEMQVYAGNVTPSPVLRNLPRLLSGKQVLLPGFYNDVAQAIQIEGNNMRYIIDGDSRIANESLKVQPGPILEIVH